MFFNIISVSFLVLILLCITDGLATFAKQRRYLELFVYACGAIYTLSSVLFLILCGTKYPQILQMTTGMPFTNLHLHILPIIYISTMVSCTLVTCVVGAIAKDFN